jgi:peptidoglycan/xylan/chitin deacetylase (PgdA/CDA1 family)
MSKLLAVVSRQLQGACLGLLHGNGREQGIRAWTYHGILETRRDRVLERNFTLLKNFQDHVRFFRRLRVLSLGELAGEIRHGAKPRSGIVITFDDGYRNNLQAAEILSSYRIPWCVFATVGAIVQESTIWTAELSLLLLHGSAARIELLNEEWPMGTRQEREATFRSIRYALKRMTAGERRASMVAIRAQFPAGETARLIEQFPSFAMLNWKELGQLSSSGVEVGSHGAEHEIHHEEQLPETLDQELVESKKILEARLGRMCRFFAFPNGNYREDSPRQVERAGYELAFTTVDGVITPRSNPYLLPRIEASDSVNKLVRCYYSAFPREQRTGWLGRWA